MVVGTGETMEKRGECIVYLSTAVIGVLRALHSSPSSLSLTDSSLHSSSSIPPQGEEINVGIRGFTHGYDFYAPRDSVVFHEYAALSKRRKKIPMFW